MCPPVCIEYEQGGCQPIPSGAAAPLGVCRNTCQAKSPLRHSKRTDIEARVASLSEVCCGKPACDFASAIELW